MGAVLDPELNSPKHEKMTDDVLSKPIHAHRDVRPELSLLDLFSYDRLSTAAPEKGWILPLPFYLSKPVRLQYPTRWVPYEYQQNVGFLLKIAAVISRKPSGTRTLFCGVGNMGFGLIEA